jgi:hypothetical protein
MAGFVHHSHDLFRGKHMLRRIMSVVASTLLVGSMVALPAAIGTSTASARCQDPYVTYSTWLIRTMHRKFPDYPVWVNGPGGSMSVTTRKTDTRTGTFGVATDVEIKGIIASAKVHVSSTIARTVSAEVGVTYTHKISRGYYGHMAYGTFAKKVGWKKVLHTSLCTKEVLKRGKAVIPTHSLGIRFWQTR